mgnify:CR=1 FL=1
MSGSAELTRRYEELQLVYCLLLLGPVNLIVLILLGDNLEGLLEVLLLLILLLIVLIPKKCTIITIIYYKVYLYFILMYLILILLPLKYYIYEDEVQVLTFSRLVLTKRI